MFRGKKGREGKKKGGDGGGGGEKAGVAGREALPMIVLQDGVEGTKVRTLDLHSPEDLKLLPPDATPNNSHTPDEVNHHNNHHVHIDFESPVAEEPVFRAPSRSSVRRPPPTKHSLHVSPVKAFSAKFSPRMGRSLRFRKGKLTFEEKDDDVHPEDDRSSFFARVSGMS